VIRAIGPYELVRRIGRGGMAEVHLAIAHGASGFQREVAIKLLAPELAGDHELERALIHEATLGGRLHHRNLVAVLGLGVHDGNYYAVLEYVDGRDLASHLDVILECSAEPSVLAGRDGQPRYVIDTNLTGCVNCLELARATGAAFVFLSTSRVYPTATLARLHIEPRGTRFALLDGIARRLAVARLEPAIGELAEAEGVAVEERRLTRIADKELHVVDTLKLQRVVTHGGIIGWRGCFCHRRGSA